MKNNISGEPIQALFLVARKEQVWILIFFLDKCKSIVAEYTNEHLDKSDKKEISVADVFVVWYCKTLKNAKVLLSTTLFDGMYYEITYNGEKEELYLDAYKKFENRCIKMEV